MKNEILILELGAEGGSLKLFQINDHFIYTTDEGTLRDFDPELTLDECVSKSNVFITFEAAMKSLLENYKIFNFSPWTVHHDFKDKLIPYYQGFCCRNQYEEQWNKDKWDKLFY
jgi:hypothetical protein